MIIRFYKGRHHPSWQTQDIISEIIFEIESMSIKNDCLQVRGYIDYELSVVEIQIFDDTYYLCGSFYSSIDVISNISNELNITHNFSEIKELALLGG